MSTLLTDLSSLLLTCADSTGGELPSYLKLHVLPHLAISPGLQVRLMLCPIFMPDPQMLKCRKLHLLVFLFLLANSKVLSSVAKCLSGLCSGIS